MIRTSLHTQAWLKVTIPIAILLAVSAAAGLASSSLYRDSPDLAAQAKGQDVITLVVALPALVISAWLAGRGSQQARLVWLGILIYVAYTYASYAFGIQFNPLFLGYVALLGCSVYALIGGLTTTDLAEVKAEFGARTPVRAVAIFLLVIAALFYLIWLSETVPASLAGIPPESVRQDGTPTNVVHVLDMGLLLPALVMAAASLLRRRPLGYALAAPLLVNLVLLALAILSMITFQSRAGTPAALPFVVIFVVLFVVSLGMLVWYLGNMRPAASAQQPAR